MDAVWSRTARRSLEGFRVTLLLLVVAGVRALMLGTLIAAMRISPVGALRGFATFYTEIAAQHPAHARPLLPRVRAADARRPAAVPRLAFIALTLLHLAVRRRGAPLRDQRRARRTGRGGAQHRARIRPDASRSSSCRRPFRMIDPAADQRLHRTHEEHVGRRRLLRGRALRDDPPAGERQRQHRHPDPPRPRPRCIWSSPSRSACSPGGSRSEWW